MENDTDWTTACGSVERDAIEDFTTELRWIKETNKCVSDVKLHDTHLTIQGFCQLDLQRLQHRMRFIIQDMDAVAAEKRLQGSSRLSWSWTLCYRTNASHPHPSRHFRRLWWVWRQYQAGAHRHQPDTAELMV